MKNLKSKSVIISIILLLISLSFYIKDYNLQYLTTPARIIEHKEVIGGSHTVKKLHIKILDNNQELDIPVDDNTYYSSENDMVYDFNTVDSGIIYRYDLTLLCISFILIVYFIYPLFCIIFYEDIL